jgi:hypothetical protein
MAQSGQSDRTCRPLLEQQRTLLSERFTSGQKKAAQKQQTAREAMKKGPQHVPPGVHDPPNRANQVRDVMVARSNQLSRLGVFWFQTVFLVQWN